MENLKKTSINGSPLFDEVRLVTQLGGDRHLAKIIIDSATGDMTNYFVRLVGAIESQQWQDTQRIIHTMKGLSSQLGGARLAQTMEFLHERLKAGGTMEMTTVSSLRSDYDELAALLSEWKP